MRTESHSQIPDPASTSRYVQNKQIRITATVESGIGAFKVEAAIRGEGLRCITVRADTAPHAYGLLHEWKTNHSQTGFTIGAREIHELTALGILVPAEQMPQRVLFSSGSDDDLCHPMVEETEGQPRSSWKLNPDIKLETKEESVSSATSQWRKVARLGADDLVWIQGSRPNLELPYWLNSSEASWVGGLLSRRFDPTEIPKNICRKLSSIEVVDKDESIRKSRRGWEETFGTARREISQRGYAIIRNLIPPVFLSALARYYKELLEQGYLLPDTDRIRFSLKNEPFSRWLHRQTQPFIIQAIPEVVTATYPYVAVYMAGADLERHTDRVDCEYTLSLSINPCALASKAESWPLYLESRTEGSTVSACLSPGDGIIFKGRELPHFRLPLPEDRISFSLLFHYAPAHLRWANNESATTVL